MDGIFARCLLLILTLLLTACATAPAGSDDRDALHQNVLVAINRFKQADPTIAKWFDGAAGFAIFPEIGKGAWIVGGAYGRGELIEAQKLVGYCDITQGSIGLQAGGQAYAEVIFFQTPRDIERFKYGDVEFAAQMSAIAATAGASADADYRGGVVVFTMPLGGLMGEVSVGGQRFTYRPK